MEAQLKITSCRACGSECISSVFDLGFMKHAGIFPRHGENLDDHPVGLSFCSDCSLVQMSYSYDLSEMYGANYGYRSGLNASMVKHLKEKVEYLLQFKCPDVNLVALDIGSNDGTLLGFYPDKYTKIGIDPTANKFRQYYQDDVVIIPDFFSSENFFKSGQRKADIITSISMFYDLENPIEFSRNVYESLSDEGIWHFEQSYCKDMIEKLSYDTICHEHLEYYSLRSIKHLMEESDFKIIDLRFNKVNGGSIAITACKKSNKKYKEDKLINWVLSVEDKKGLNTKRYYENFARNSQAHALELREFVEYLNQCGFSVYGYGASTKGNVLLQFSKLDNRLIKAIFEVNEDKFGCVTPGTNIPILSDSALSELGVNDYVLVLPWHFEDFILEKEKHHRQRGVKFIFPFPSVRVL